MVVVIDLLEDHWGTIDRTFNTNVSFGSHIDFGDTMFTDCTFENTIRGHSELSSSKHVISVGPGVALTLQTLDKSSW